MGGALEEVLADAAVVFVFEAALGAAAHDEGAGELALGTSDRPKGAGPQRDAAAFVGSSDDDEGEHDD